MAIFGDFLRPLFSASRVQHVSDLHLKFALRPHHVWKYGKGKGFPYSIPSVGPGADPGVRQSACR